MQSHRQKSRTFIKEVEEGYRIGRDDAIRITSEFAFADEENWPEFDGTIEKPTSHGSGGAHDDEHQS